MDPSVYRVVRVESGHEFHYGSRLECDWHYEPQDVVRYDHGLYCPEDGEQYVAANAIAHQAGAGPALFAAVGALRQRLRSAGYPAINASIAFAVSGTALGQALQALFDLHERVCRETLEAIEAAKAGTDLEGS